MSQDDLPAPPSRSAAWLSARLPRRDLLELTGALGAVMGARLLVGCSGSSSDPNGVDAGPLDSGVPEGLSAFTVFRGVRDVLRTSPDHLPARAEQLVAAGDAQGLFELVRDGVRTYPTSADQFFSRDIIRRQSFGSRATLRGGAGTPRDQAELLRELYERAGFEAEVVKGPVEAPFRDLASWLLAQPEPPAFAPNIDAEELDRWLATLGVDTSAEAPEDIDPDRSASRTLGERLFELAEGDVFVRPFSFSWLEELPLVRVVVDGETRHACPALPSAEFGDSCTTNIESLGPEDAAELDSVRIRLESATHLDPRERFLLVDGEWSAADVLGRQIHIALVPGLDLPGRLEKRVSEVPFVIPTLGVQALDDPESSEALTVVGEPVFPDGRRMTVAPDGSVLIDGVVLGGPDGPRGTASDVVDIAELSLDPGRFDAVTVAFTPRDGGGEPVEGLLAADLVVEEDGVRQSHVLQANRSAPRVIVLIDQSASMPDAWIEPDRQEAFMQLLRSRVEPIFPGALLTRTESDSRTWTRIADAANRAPTTIVFVTDGDVVDEKTPELEAALANGPAAVIVDVNDGRGNRAALEEMASLSGGVVIDATDQEAAADALVEYLRDLTPPAYALWYRAPVDGPPSRTVAVRVPGSGASVEGTYAVPESSRSPALAGLYLTVEIGDRSVTRTLAGLHHEASTRDPIPEDAIEQVRRLFVSDIALGLEGPAPSLSVLMEDVLTARLGLEPLYEAFRRGSDADLLSVLDAGLPRMPAELAAILPPFGIDADPETLTFETGPRATLVIEGPLVGPPRYGRRVDVLPFGTPSTAMAGEDGGRLRVTSQQTARLAVAEREWHARSTLGLLEERDLTFIGRGSARHFSDRTDLDDGTKARWNQVLSEYGTSLKIVPTSGEPVAFWAMDRETGAILGILEDGSGGAATYIDIQNAFAETIAVAETLNLVALLADEADRLLQARGSGALAGVSEPIGVAAATGQVLAQLFGPATLIIASLDAYEIPEFKRRDVWATACVALQTLMPSGWYKGADNVLSQLILNDSSLDCVGAGD